MLTSEAETALEPAKTPTPGPLGGHAASCSGRKAPQHFQISHLEPGLEKVL